MDVTEFLSEEFLGLKKVLEKTRLRRRVEKAMVSYAEDCMLDVTEPIEELMRSGKSDSDILDGIAKLFTE